MSAPLSIPTGPSGESFVFHTSFRGPAREFRFTWTLQPGKSGPGEHNHLRESHFFKVVSGRIAVWLDGVRHDYEAGAELTIPPGVAHRFHNFSPEPVVVDCAMDGAAFEDFLIPMALAFQSAGGKIGLKEGGQLLVQLVATDPTVPVGATRFAVPPLRALEWVCRKVFGFRPLPPVIGWDQPAAAAAETSAPERSAARAG